MPVPAPAAQRHWRRVWPHQWRGVQAGQTSQTVPGLIPLLEHSRSPERLIPKSSWAWVQEWHPALQLLVPLLLLLLLEVGLLDAMILPSDQDVQLLLLLLLLVHYLLLLLPSDLPLQAT